MRTFLFSLALLSSSAYAEKTIPLADVASAFIWVKIAPEFPITLTSQAEDQVSFRIFDDVYSITKKKLNFQVIKKSYLHEFEIGEEVISLEPITIEKLLKFVKSSVRAAAVLPEDAFLNSIQTKTPPEGYESSKTIYQCKSDLPSRITKDGSVINKILQHTWIQNGSKESFGMPNTDEGSYFGGLAHIRTPDSFIGKAPQHLECSPVLIPVGANEQKISRNIACLARRLSLSQNPVFEEPKSPQDWIAHFDYHALDRNCLVAVRFVLECAGAKASQVVNAGIGGKLDWSDVYSVSEYPASLKMEMNSLRGRLQRLRAQVSIADLPAQAEQLMNEAVELDLRVRGVTGETTPKKLLDLCELALQNCPL